MFALIDCNNFFASCERIFRPDLKNKPVVVLSNNDGCVIARSNESKELQIPMGAPYFKCKDIIEKNKVAVFSSNYELYGDISNRVMDIIANLFENYEIYSVDEAFIRLDSVPQNEIVNLMHQLRKTIMKHIGITVSIGIGPSKTLAKIANHTAKKHPLLCIYKGIFDIREQHTQDMVLQHLKLLDIWGISRGLEARLSALGIKSAIALRDSDTKIMRKSFSVVMEKMILELRGISCIELEQNFIPRQNIMSSRSFGRDVTSLSELEEAISSYTAKAAAKMRKQSSKARGIYVFLKSDKYKAKGNNYKYSNSQMFTHTVSDTSFLISRAKELLNAMYVPGIKYKKAGIMLINLTDKEYEQMSLFEEVPISSSKSDLLMSILDKTNNRFGKGTLLFAAEGIKKEWQMKRERKSPSYTTNWNELAIVV